MIEEKSSFRDPSGRVFTDYPGIVREIYPAYYTDYQYLKSSKLYEALTAAHLLIPHTEIEDNKYHILIRPEIIPFISYPYEWCFSMLKDAALTTLRINRVAMEHGMILKDASAYNMQYYKGDMTLIDTLSFMKYEVGMPWGAYRQFLQHFLCPLLLMAYRDISLNKLLSSCLDGIPVKLTTKLLPFLTRFKPAVFAHVYAQSLNFTVSENRNVTISGPAFFALLDNLERLVALLEYKQKGKWQAYQDDCHYNPAAVKSKESLVEICLIRADAKQVLDLGSNTGTYANLAHHKGARVIAVDSDASCIERIYNYDGTHVLPLVVDLCNPSPAIGWANTERKSFWDRVNVDTIMALALIHHLCIANNVPLGKVAELLAGHCRNLIIEFVPLDDPKAKQLLGKKNIPPYSLDIFKYEFGKHFIIKGEYPITESDRTIYLMEKK